MQAEEKIIDDREINLDQFLKWIGVIPTGGALKPLLEEGKVYRNGEKESARRRKLVDGDRIEVKGIGSYIVRLKKS